MLEVIPISDHIEVILFSRCQIITQVGTMLVLCTRTTKLRSAATSCRLVSASSRITAVSLMVITS